MKYFKITVYFVTGRTAFDTNWSLADKFFEFETPRHLTYYNHVSQLKNIGDLDRARTDDLQRDRLAF